VYLRDTTGKQVLEGTKATVPAASTTTSTTTASSSSTLSIGTITISEVSSAGYRVTAQISAPAGVKEVLMPTWTEANGQDDLIWHVATVSGNTATYYVKASDHKGESGTYITHVYLRDTTGKQVIEGTTATLPAASGSSSASSTAPSIGTITVSEISASGYRVTAQISAPAGVKEVLMPTWTEANGQDDLVWHTATVSGNTATCYISAASHKGESGAYITHVYLYDANGAKALEGTTATVPAQGQSSVNTGTNTGSLSLSIPYITSLDATGYTIQVTFSAPSGVKRIAAAVWQIDNGQDDLVWHEMTISGSTAVVRIPVSDHGNLNGIYATNVYIWDNAGGQYMTAANVPVP
jgi:hypothetical protein